MIPSTMGTNSVQQSVELTTQKMLNEAAIYFELIIFAFIVIIFIGWRIISANNRRYDKEKLTSSKRIK